MRGTVNIQMSPIGMGIRMSPTVGVDMTTSHSMADILMFLTHTIIDPIMIIEGMKNIITIPLPKLLTLLPLVLPLALLMLTLKTVPPPKAMLHTAPSSS